MAIYAGYAHGGEKGRRGSDGDVGGEDEAGGGVFFDGVLGVFQTLLIKFNLHEYSLYSILLIMDTVGLFRPLYKANNLLYLYWKLIPS